MPSRAGDVAGCRQAAVGAIWWLCSLSKLWVAVMRRHSDRQADMPRRKKRSIRRLNLVCARIGSIVTCRLVALPRPPGLAARVGFALTQRPLQRNATQLV
jgi:hypothetical protein